MAGNVPLNEKLARISIGTASGEEMAAARSAFEGSWTGLHLVRTGAAVGSLVLACFAMQTRTRHRK